MIFNKLAIPPNILGVALLLISSFCFGHSNLADSLLKSLTHSSDSIKGGAYYQLAEIRYAKKNYPSTINYLKKSIKYDLASGKLEDVSNSLNLIGSSFLKQKNYNSALKNYLTALDISEKIKDTVGIAKNLNSIGAHYGFLNDHKTSLEYHLKAIAYIETIDNNMEIKSKSLNNIGMCYGYLDQVDKSIEYFKQSLPLRQKIGNIENISILLNNLGYAYSLKKDYKMAYEQLELSLTICEQISDKKGMAYALLNIAELNIAQNKHQQAIPILTRSLEISKEIKMNILIQDSYRFLAKSYAALGNPKMELLYFKKFNSIQKEILIEQKENSISNINLVNTLEIKKQELNQLNKENELKKFQLESKTNSIYMLVAFLTILITLLIILYFQKINLKNSYKTLALKNIEIVQGDSQNKKQKTKPSKFSPKSNDKKYKGSPLSEEQKNDILEKINQKMNEEKLFLKNDFTLFMLADIIGINKSYISQVINENFDKNFSTYINEYRIIEARNLLSKEENWKLTIEAVANSVGFKSISAFNTAFKKFTGITPSYFVKTVKSPSQNNG